MARLVHGALRGDQRGLRLRGKLGAGQCARGRGGPGTRRRLRATGRADGVPLPHPEQGRIRADDRPRGHAARGRDGNGPCGTRRGSGHSGDRGRRLGPHLRRVPAQGRRGLRTRQRVPAAVGLARPRRPASQPAEPHARRRRCGKRARARARGAPCEPRDLAQDGAARGGGGARRRGGSRLRGRQHQRARGERRPCRDGRHADLPRRVARGPLGRGAGAARAGGVARPRPQDAAHRAARQRRLRGGGAGRRERRRPRGRRARHSRQCRKARRLRAPAHRGLARVRRGGEGPHAAGRALRAGPRRGRPDHPGARRDARRDHGPCCRGRARGPARPNRPGASRREPRGQRRRARALARGGLLRRRGRPPRHRGGRRRTGLLSRRPRTRL